MFPISHMRHYPGTSSAPEVIEPPTEQVRLFSYEVHEGRVTTAYLCDVNFPYLGYVIDMNDWHKIQVRLPSLATHASQAHVAVQCHSKLEGTWDELTDLIDTVSKEFLDNDNQTSGFEEAIKNVSTKKTRVHIHSTLGSDTETN